MDIEQVARIGVNNGIGVVCAILVLWFAYYRETKTLPKLIESFAAGLKTSQEHFDKRNKEVVESNDKRNLSLVQAFERQMDRERDVCQRWHEENRHKLDQVLGETKEQRHLIVNLAHAAHIKYAADEAEARGRASGGDPDTPV